jgi:hypothetical protein
MAGIEMGGLRMATHDHRHSPPPDTSITSVRMLVAHVVWVLAGPPLLFVLGVAILLSGGHWFGLVDIAFFALAVAMLACRWLDQRTGHAVDSFCEPVTWADFRMYAVKLLAATAAIWCVAHAARRFLPDALFH